MPTVFSKVTCCTGLLLAVIDSSSFIKGLFTEHSIIFGQPEITNGLGPNLNVSTVRKSVGNVTVGDKVSLETVMEQQTEGSAVASRQTQTAELPYVGRWKSRQNETFTGAGESSAGVREPKFVNSETR